MSFIWLRTEGTEPYRRRSMEPLCRSSGWGMKEQNRTEDDRWNLWHRSLRHLPPTTHQLPHHYRQMLDDWNENLDDPRIHMIDGIGLTSSMHLYAEFPGEVHGSSQWHRFCRDRPHELYQPHHGNDTLGTEAVAICSNVTETIANLLFARALAPNGKSTGNTEIRTNHSDFQPSKRRLVVCTDCPARKLPFHIKPIPNLTCHVGRLQAQQRGEIGDEWQKAAKCPATCLAEPPTKRKQTRSGTVLVRECSLWMKIGRAYEKPQQENQLDPDLITAWLSSTKRYSSWKTLMK